MALPSPPTSARRTTPEGASRVGRGQPRSQRRRTRIQARTSSGTATTTMMTTGHIRASLVHPAPPEHRGTPPPRNRSQAHRLARMAARGVWRPSRRHAWALTLVPSPGTDQGRGWRRLAQDLHGRRSRAVPARGTRGVGCAGGRRAVLATPTDTRNGVPPRMRLCPTACPIGLQFLMTKPNGGNHDPRVGGSSPSSGTYESPLRRGFRVAGSNRAVAWGQPGANNRALGFRAVSTPGRGVGRRGRGRSVLWRAGGATTRP